MSRFPETSASPRILIAFLGTALALLAGCAAPTPAGPPECSEDTPPAQVVAKQIPDSLWNPARDRAITGTLDTAMQARLERTVDEFLERSPGASVAVAIPGAGLWSVQKGLANTAAADSVSADDRFQIASITKTFTAAVILQLVDESRLRLDDRVATWFPDVPNADLMTVEHLLRHTNGLQSFNALPELGDAYRTPDETIALAAARPPLFCPGAAWAYTNTGYALLGRIIEHLEDKPLIDVFRERITEPLNLGRTVLRAAGDGLEDVVTGHASRAPVTVADDYATAYAAGSVASTAADVVRFWHAFLTGDLFAREHLPAVFSGLHAMDAGNRTFYGLGVQVYDIPEGPGLMLGHSGGITGFTSVVAYLPADDLYVAVVFNDKNVPAEAGLWSLVQAVRAYRSDTE